MIGIGAPSRKVLILTPEEAPLSSEFFLFRGPATVSSSLSDSVAITDGDPVPDSPGEDGSIASWLAWSTCRLIGVGEITMESAAPVFEVTSDSLVERVPTNVPITGWSASELPQLEERLRAKLQNAGPPTPTQRHAVPVGLAGHDLIVNSCSHDVLALMLPLLSPLMADETVHAVASPTANGASSGDSAGGGGALSRPRALVIAPTRPLLAAAEECAASLTRGSGVRYAVAGGSAEWEETLAALRVAGTSLVLGSPGRLLDLVGYLAVLALDQVACGRAGGGEAGLSHETRGLCSLLAPGRTLLLMYIGLLVRASAIRVASSDAEQGALSSRLVTQRAVYAVDGGRMDKFAQIASSSGLVLCVARQRQDCELLSFRLRDEGLPVADASAERLKPREREALLSSFASGEPSAPRPPHTHDQTCGLRRGGHVGSVTTIVGDADSGDALCRVAAAMREARQEARRPAKPTA
ncbi:hypothetical protein EMIHUDRAFT_232467 [Emiliania huxleyi CCMP1516]|uniref:DEAD/DEAH box helicase domain-containing protein n=2 Tax=Emiliania huxleyi TaxID=2903 RepID=A0A0D3K4J1_EMIH1|nr:hypothetical protein EMIHUDRAFT_232467 [Emiliania huxleyi CCMP1516]EOD30676.1 hypothetical protein EMIHUDRAFT_232467 [Emiliania huxleyi CCMP1516]|eukprot:XP_005783105.1 hypothetical protein EMIHUDRAFT_232467 [Emiliania huxleyi CCMP1516]